MKANYMQVEILARTLSPTDGEPIHVERTVKLMVLEDTSSPKAVTQLGPMGAIAVLDGEVWMQPATPESEVNPAGLHADYMLVTTARKHWDNRQQIDGDRAALHSETSRMVGRALFFFGHHPKATLLAHEKLSYDRHIICVAADAVNNAEKALLDALPYMDPLQVRKLIDDHFKKLVDGAEPARILTGIPPDVLG